jgi:hypothetical protein
LFERGNDRLNAPSFEEAAHGVAVVAAIADQTVGLCRARRNRCAGTNNGRSGPRPVKKTCAVSSGVTSGNFATATKSKRFMTTGQVAQPSPRGKMVRVYLGAGRETPR